MRKARFLPYLLLAPALILLATFKLYPILKSFYLSTLNYNLTDPLNQGFVGLANFKDILIGEGGERFWPAIMISGIWVVGSVASQFAIGLTLALLLNQHFKGRGFFRSLVLSPWAISGVIISFIWGWMLHGQVGLINDVLLRLHIIKVPIGWLARPWTAMLSVVMANAWRGSAFFAVTLLAALQSVPDELHEAASIDGASRLGRFRFVTLPMIREMIIITTALRCIWTFNNVDLIFVMTRGGPVNSTKTLAVYIFTTFIDSLKLGYGSALGVIMFFVLLVFTIVYFKLTRFGEAR